jgi:cyanophycinase
VRAAAAWRHDFETAGVRNIEIPIVANRTAASDPAIRIARRVSRRDLPRRRRSGAPHRDAERDAGRRGDSRRIRRGAVVCGTSAGAAALTETTMAGGEVDEDGNEVEMYIGPGLGLLCFGT